MARLIPAFVFALAMSSLFLGADPRSLHAAEAAFPHTGQAALDIMSADESRRLQERLQRERFTIAGEVRRKGPLLIAVGLQQGQPWRLVIDTQSGEIIGRRSLGDHAIQLR